MCMLRNGACPQEIRSSAWTPCIIWCSSMWPTPDGSRKSPPLNVSGFLNQVLLKAPAPGKVMREALTEYAQQIAREQLHTHTAREVFRDGSRDHWVRWNHRPRLWTEDPSRMRRPHQREDCRLAAVDIQSRGSSELNPLHKQQINAKLLKAIDNGQAGNMMLLP